MKKYRVWYQSISHVYLDVEAESKEEAKQIAEDADGGEFTTSQYGHWEFDEIIEL